MHSKVIALTALAASALAQMDMGNSSLTSVLSSAADLSNLTSFVSQFPQLLTTLSSATNITILAPSNEAFGKFLQSPAASAVTANDSNAIQALLSYHVLNGTYPAAAVKETPAFIPTLLNNPAYANVTGGQVVEAIAQDDSVVFFSGLLSNSTVTKADTNFTGGVVHIIDTVLTPPQNVSTTAQAAGLTALVGAVSKNPQIASTLDTTPDLTVFAPNNEAFQSIASILQNITTQQLSAVLGYHVINGTVAYSSTLTNGTSVPTLAGPNVTITISGDDVFVNSAKVVIPDVLVANGVVHVIDGVLNPNATAAAPNPEAETQSAAFPGASSLATVPFTSGVPAPTMAIGAGAGGAGGGGGGGQETGTPPATGSATGATGTGAAMPMRTGAMGAAALFAGAGVWLNV
ncbi:MAG: hypothetical protein Q9167_005923 [Letrouitia subvulpina]